MARSARVNCDWLVGFEGDVSPICFLSFFFPQVARLSRWRRRDHRYDERSLVRWTVRADRFTSPRNIVSVDVGERGNTAATALYI